MKANNKQFFLHGVGISLLFQSILIQFTIVFPYICN